MVALHEVLDDQLPVRLDVVDDPPADLEGVDGVVVDRLDVAEPGPDRAHHGVLERRRLVGDADPDVAEPLADVRGAQAVLLPADVGHPGQVRGGDQLAVQIVGPGVVRALERALGLAAVRAAQPGAAVPADVEERARLPLAVTAEDQALPADLHGLEVARLGQLAAAGGAEPHLLEDPFLLLPEDLRGGVGVPGQGSDQALGDAVAGVLEDRRVGSWGLFGQGHADSPWTAAGTGMTRRRRIWLKWRD